MQRRQFLGGAALSAGIGLAGCSVISADRLAPTEEETEDNIVHLLYHDDGHIATLSLVGQRHDDMHERYFPLRVHLWKEADLDADSLRYEFRTPGLTLPDHPPTFYLERLRGSPWEPVQFSRDEDGDTTVFEVSELGFQGRGSVTVDLLVEHHNDKPFDLRLDADVVLDAGRLSSGYELTGTATVEIPAARI